MAVGAEAILVCVGRFLHFSMKTGSVCVQKHPFVSAILFFFYILYAFFNLFIFWFPFLVCIAILLRGFWTSGGLTILEAKRDEKRNDYRMPCKKSEPVRDDGGGVANRDRCSLTKQKSRRTNVARRCRVGDAQANKEEEERCMSTTSLNGNLIGGMIDKNTKLVKEEKKNYTFVHGESSTAKASAGEKIQLLVEQHRSVLDSDLSDSHLLSSDDSDGQTEKFKSGGVNGEVAQEDGNNKVVQWTDDDKKNLMDLGLSEIERNKRLESLIARRRARKLFKMQVEKGLINLDTVIPGQIAPILIARNNPLQFVEGSNEMDTPGSAPSILLPIHNPFDLPYDPREEKPNLMADSFQHEFATARQKEMFCRHESFSLGPSFPSESKKKAMDGKGYSIFKKLSSVPAEEMGGHDKYIERMSSGKHDDVIEALLSKVRDSISDVDRNRDIADKGSESPIQATNSVNPKDEENKETQSVIDIKGMDKTENTSGVQVEPHVTDDSNDETSSSSFSEENDQTSIAIAPQSPQNAISKGRRVPPKPLSCSAPKSKTAKEVFYDSSPSGNERSRLEEHLFYSERGACHTPTYSLASDLQVEVSELGSPPLTVDGANSPTDRESLNLDGDFEKEYMWGVSSQSSRAEENEPKSREVRGLSEKDLTDIRFSGNIQRNKDVAESSMPLQQLDELDDVCSVSSSLTEICGDSQSYSMNSDGKTYNDIRQVGEEVGNPRASSSLSIALSPENQEETMKMTEKLVSVNPEKSSSPPDETIKKVNVPATNAIDNSIDEKKNTYRDSGVQILSMQAAVGELPKPNAGTISESSRSLERSSLNPAERQATAVTIQLTKDNKASNHVEGGLQKVIENEGNKETDVKKNSSTTEGSKDGQGTTEMGVSEEKQISGDSIVSVAPKNLANKDVHVNSIASSSPTSVLLEHIQKDHVSVSNANPKKHIGAPKPEVGDKVKSTNLSAEKPHDSTLLTPQNEKHYVEESTGHRSNTSDSKKPQEPFRPPRKSTEEANIISEKPAKEIGNLSQNATEVASELKKQAEEIGKVSQKATETAAELKKPAEEIESASYKTTEVVAGMKRPAEEIINVSQKATEAAAELKKPAVQIANVSQKAEEPIVEFKKPAEETWSSSTKATEAATQLKKQIEEIEDESQKATKVDAEVKKPAEAIANVNQKATKAGQSKNQSEENEEVSQKATKVDAELEKPSEEITNVSQKAKVAVAKFKTPVEEIGHISQKAIEGEQAGNVLSKAIEAASYLKKPEDEVGSVSKKETVATEELKKAADEIGSVSQKESKAPAELKTSSEEVGNVSQKESKALVELKKSSEEIGSVSQKAREAAELKNPANETGNVSQKASETAAELKTPAQKIENVSGKAIEEVAEMKNQEEKIGNVSQKVTGVAAELENLVEKVGIESQKTPEATAKLKKPAEELGSASRKATEAYAELKKPSDEIERGSQKPIEDLVQSKSPIEEIGNVSQQATKAGPEVINPARESGNLSQKASEPAAEAKKPEESFENVLGKMAKDTAKLKETAEEVRNVSHKATEAAAEMKKPAEEIRSVSQKASKAPTELEKPSDVSGGVSQKATEIPGELKRSAEEVGIVSEKETYAELKKPAKEIKNVSQKASKAPTELKKSAEEIGNVSQNATKVSTDEKIGNVAPKASEAATELRRPLEEFGTVSQKTTAAALELKKPTEAAAELTKPTEAAAELTKPIEEIKT